MQNQPTSIIKAAGKIIRDLVSRPYDFTGESENEGGETIFAEPFSTEMPIDGSRPALYPAEGYLQDGIQFLKGRTIWAVDGGILPWQFPNGILLIGRAVVTKMTFNGYESVQRVFDVPLMPFIVYPSFGSGDTSLVDDLTKDYLQYVIGKIPLPTSAPTNLNLPNSFTDTENFLAGMPESYFAGSVVSRQEMADYIDHIRNAAELLAFIYALRSAKSKDIVMRDGRLNGGAGFLTGFVKKEQTPDELEKGKHIVRQTVREIQNAVDHGVRVIGVIKHPNSNYVTRWYANHDVERAKYVASDALLYYREIEPMPSERTTRLYGAGKRSTLWQIREGSRDAADTPVDLEHGSGRALVHWFYQNTGCFFLKPKEGVLPLRIDFIMHNNHYRSWFADNLTEQIYSLCTGSGSPLGLPQPIVIADGYAKVHRPELTRNIDGMLANFESSDDPEDKKIARELRAYLDIYYRGAL